jgi:pentatricopeptide repeat protein
MKLNLVIPFFLLFSAYSAAISALSKGQMWAKALELFREIEASGGKPSIVTYNATMTALEKGLQWERALDLFDEMKLKNMPVTVVSYGSAISACEKGKVDQGLSVVRVSLMDDSTLFANSQDFSTGNASNFSTK